MSSLASVSGINRLVVNRRGTGNTTKLVVLRMGKLPMPLIFQSTRRRRIQE
jgi:hypothetical protein